MKVEEKYLDVLQNIETMILAVYAADPDLLDLQVLDALEAMIRLYTQEEGGRGMGTLSLSGRPQRVADAIRGACEWRLGRGGEGFAALAPTPAISVPEVLLCLKRLRRSVRLWNKASGRQGYLSYVRSFLEDAAHGRT